MEEMTKRILKRIGVVKTARQAKSLLLRDLFMKFPTFPDEVNKLISVNNDYFRYATMSLAIMRLINENIQGDFAEVGVYKGDTSQILYKLGSDRRYYLFDTFEGFPEKDLESNITNDNRFKDTSVKMVLNKIGSTNNVIIKKGYVPETLIGLEEERFAFVLLDLDLYLPTKKSLEFFYPRISKGGYIFVHDYNSPESNWAISRAVNEFMENKPEKIMEIADNWGSIMFRKL
ncbi:MAG: TylF/MycF/NovP-related O-methyltransferase [Clostridiales bacterium]